jgi:hypothetical protein
VAALAEVLDFSHGQEIKPPLQLLYDIRRQKSLYDNASHLSDAHGGLVHVGLNTRQTRYHGVPPGKKKAGGREPPARIAA